MLLVKEANLKKQPTEWLHLHDLPAELGRQCKAWQGRGWGGLQRAQSVFRAVNMPWTVLSQQTCKSRETCSTSPECDPNVNVGVNSVSVLLHELSH